jgi:hypothetical protein
MRRFLVVGGCVGALAVPAGAGAAGGPVPAVQGGAGVSVRASAASYVAVAVGRRTLVEQVLRPAGAIARTQMLDGAYGVPGVAYDGSTTGLSADGRTLVLAEVVARFPVRRTRLLVLDARRLRVARRIALPGYFTVDAISPDGRSLYLIRYLRQDGTRYDVRAYDLDRNRLAPAPVVDVREPDEKMQGLPLTRATGPDGRFAYTLYQRPEGEPFIHALDTARGAAACTDLPALEGADLVNARLVPPAGTRPLLVRTPGRATLAVDVATRSARPVSAARPEPAAAAPAPAPARERGAASDGVGWLVGGLALAALVAGLTTAARRRRRLRVPA